MTKSKVVNIRKLAEVIRSKNAGPFELTFDMIFKDRKTYEKVKRTRVITKDLIAKLYSIPIDQVITFVEYDPGNAIKATIRRHKVSGDVGDSDVYGCQQHAPLLSIELPFE